MNKEKKVIIELVMPDGENKSYEDLLNAIRQNFHDVFRGSKDYIDSNVVVWDNRCNHRDHKTFNEVGIVVDFTKTTNGLSAARKLKKAISNMYDNEMFTNMTIDTTANTKASKEDKNWNM